ncbi:MAG TPA: amino acid adenylation domain-containing protein [Casimicrobiaceae bacterium]
MTAQGFALHRYLVDAALRAPDATAVVDPGHGSIRYDELDALSDRVRDRLGAMGVRPGDRVGIYLRKSIDSVAAIHGILKSGAAYVPVDPLAPPARNAYILHDCAVAAVLIEQRFDARFREEHRALGPIPQAIVVERVGGGSGLRDALGRLDDERPATSVPTARSAPADLAYILYTSGSTGKPKGVMLSHENATSFVDWCSEALAPRADDRFSSHAPFHFDLSILDIHVCVKHGATLVLIGEDAGKDPERLAALIADERISVWYSAPSILGLLAQYGRLPARDCSQLRLVLFAGEVFPVKHLRALTEQWPGRRYLNLYGPTETNVCTYYEVALPIDASRTVPFPIGKSCSHLACKVVAADGADVARGEEGELVVRGRGVMQGYWSLPEQTARAFLQDATGARWYRTGDVVIEAPDGNYTYLGRRDRMVKRRGYRVELGEIEAGLYKHAAVKEAAVVALPDEEGVRIRAFLSCREERRPSLIAMKRFCAENLPLYMIPDDFSWLAELPKTSTDKVDYQRLKDLR